jgi:hypothetical protein
MDAGGLRQLLGQVSTRMPNICNAFFGIAKAVACSGAGHDAAELSLFSFAMTLSIAIDSLPLTNLLPNDTATWGRGGRLRAQRNLVKLTPAVALIVALHSIFSIYASAQTGGSQIGPSKGAIVGAIVGVAAVTGVVL